MIPYAGCKLLLLLRSSIRPHPLRARLLLHVAARLLIPPIGIRLQRHLHPADTLNSFDKAMACGFDHFVIKPAAVDTVLQAVLG